MRHHEYQLSKLPQERPTRSRSDCRRAAEATVANFRKDRLPPVNPSVNAIWAKALRQPWLLAFAMGLLNGTAMVQPARAVDFPRPGVVCDAPRQVCFDNQGASIALTRLYYGPWAGNQLLAQLSGRPPQLDFMLSGGQLCDINQRTCWDDGWRRRIVNPTLSRQLFATGANGSYGATSSTGQVPSPQPPAGERMCQLLQRGLPVFSGSCRLYRQNENVWQYYVVQMENGKLYRFQRRANSLVLRDATGMWPVMVADRGNTVQFRWANLLLDVSRPMQARGGGPGAVIPPSPTPRSTGETGDDLLDSIFQ